MRILRVLAVPLLLAACPGAAALDDDDASNEPLLDDDDAADDDAADDDDAVDDDDAADDDDDAPLRMGRCGDAAPDGADAAPPLPTYTGGVCPTLAPGPNVLGTGGLQREFSLVVPSDYDPAEGPLPVFAMWHHLGGAADSLLNHGQVQATADALRFIAVVPEKAGDLAVGWGEYVFDSAWPYLNVADADRVEEEAVFFDDMLACVAEQYDIDADCVSSVGISAGALWTAQLAHLRAERLASVVLLSGGVGPATGVGFFDVRGWTPAARAVPALVGWGGPTDYLGVNFETASQNLERELEDDGHFVLECVHNCGHGVPPVDPTVGLAALYGFALDHPYWQTPGTSVYQRDGLPEAVPAWCAIGSGQAVVRTGTCDPDDAIEE